MVQVSFKLLILAIQIAGKSFFGHAETPMITEQEENTINTVLDELLGGSASE